MDYHQKLIEQPDDTDWFIHQLYDFAPEMGISMITANYSRWVIDLNRDPDSKPLYNDGRIITSLCPAQTFYGENIYHNGMEPDEAEVQRRLGNYYKPYYEAIQQKLDELKAEFGYALLWDAHSIRQVAPLIRKESFPDLIIGDNDGKSCNNKLSQTAMNTLIQRGHQVNHNDPFKGGHITRYFGKPEEHQHAIQLEMTKLNYMGDDELQYDKPRAGRMRESLSRVFEALTDQLHKI